MKKILLLCLFLFGCDGLGVFSHGHSKGICLKHTPSIYGDGGEAMECYENLTENECLESERTSSEWNRWISTNGNCADYGP